MHGTLSLSRLTRHPIVGGNGRRDVLRHHTVMGSLMQRGA